VRETLKRVRGEEAGAPQDIPFLGRYLPAEDDPTDDEGGRSETPTGEATDTESGHRVTKKEPTTSGKATKTTRKPSLDTPTPGSTRKKQLDDDGDGDGRGEGEGGSAGGGGTSSPEDGAIPQLRY
jgi:hypothetical protein